MGRVKHPLSSLDRFQTKIPYVRVLSFSFHCGQLTIARATRDVFSFNEPDLEVEFRSIRKMIDFHESLESSIPPSSKTYSPGRLMWWSHSEGCRFKKKLISDTTSWLSCTFAILGISFLVTPELIAQQNERNDQAIHQFWNKLMSVLDNSPDQSMLQDVIVTNLKVPHDEVPESWIIIEQRVRRMLSLNQFSPLLWISRWN